MKAENQIIPEKMRRIDKIQDEMKSLILFKLQSMI